MTSTHTIAERVCAFFMASILVLIGPSARAATEKALPPLKTGDIVFQNDADEQGLAIMLATASPYTHTAIG